MITISTLSRLAQHNEAVAQWVINIVSTYKGGHDDLDYLLGGPVYFIETEEEAEAIFNSFEMDGHDVVNAIHIMFAINNNSGGPTFIFPPTVWKPEFQAYVNHLRTTA